MVKTVKGPARRTNSGWLVLPPFELISLMKAFSPTTLLSHKSWYAFTVASLRSSTVPLLCSKTFCKHLSKPSLWQRIWGLINKGALHFVSPVVGMPSARSDKRRAERTEVWISFLGIGVAQSESWTSTCLHPPDLVDADFIATQWKEELCCRSFLLCLRQASLMSLKASSECNDDSKESKEFSLEWGFQSHMALGWRRCPHANLLLWLCSAARQLLCSDAFLDVKP